MSDLFDVEILKIEKLIKLFKQKQIVVHIAVRGLEKEIYFIHEIRKTK